MLTRKCAKRLSDLLTQLLLRIEFFWFDASTWGIIASLVWFEGISLRNSCALKVDPARSWRRLLAVWFCLSTIALLMPMPEGWHTIESSTPLPLDKLAHGIGTFIGAVLARGAGWDRMRNLAVWSLYASGMEVIQAMTGLRAGDWMDFAAALVGLVLAVFLCPKWGWGARH